MLSRLFFVIFLLSIQHGLCVLDEDYEDEVSFGRCPWIRNKLKNGRVRYRYKGRVAKFLCDSGYELAGKRSSTCVRGQWSNPIPVCVARGCNRVPSIANGRVTEMYRGALLVYDCNPGYTLTGNSSIHCDGRRWNATAPVCGVNPDILPDTSCDFESPYLCGWTHDPTHNFDWRRNQFSTPSGHVGTGPAHDHTFGENKAGYYLYIEASSPRKINDTARLFSPVYPADESGGCFIFWYHMYGATTGGIRVYFKPESHVFGELSPKWEKFGNQGNQWLRGDISIPIVNENFQVVIEGIRGESYVGDSAIDDVQLTKLDCQSMENVTESSAGDIDNSSCRGRCRVSDESATCDCKESCQVARNCCSDYLTLCSDDNETFDQHTNEQESGEYYGKTTSPLTVTMTSSSVTNVEGTNSTLPSNFSSQHTSQTLSTASINAAASASSSTVTATSEAVVQSSSVSSVIPVDSASTASSTATSFKTIQSTIEVRTNVTSSYTNTGTSISTPTSVSVTETSSIQPITIDSNTTLKTTGKVITTASTIPVKIISSTKSTAMMSTRYTSKLTTNAPKAYQSTTFSTTQSTTTSSTSRTFTTTTPTSSTTNTPRIFTVATPKSTTTNTPQISTASTTKSTTNNTPLISTATTPVSTTLTESSTSATPTAMSTTGLKTTVLLPFSQTQSTSSSLATTTVSSSTSTSYRTSDKITPRYNLRPRKSTSTSASTEPYSASSNNYSTTKNSTFVSGTASTPSNTKSTVSSVISSTSQPRRWFNVTMYSRSTARSPIKTSTAIAPLITSTRFQNTQKTSKYSYRMPQPTPTEQSSSTSDSYKIIATKAESSDSNDSSVITICVVVLAIVCVVVGGTLCLRRYRRKRLSKLDDDSEMRFLPESDYMEYSDASALDRILEK